MDASQAKDSRIDLRINFGQKALLEQAAASQGKRLTEFVIAASTEAAQIALADQSRYSLGEEEMDRFVEKLEEPPQALPKLKELFSRKSVLHG